MIFNEKTLRDEIVQRWGEAGAHVLVYDKLVSMALGCFLSTLPGISELQRDLGLFCFPQPYRRGLTAPIDQFMEYVQEARETNLAYEEELSAIMTNLDTFRAIGKQYVILD